MKHTRTLLAATLALTLASCGQQVATVQNQTAGAQASTDKEVIAGAYLVGFKQSALSAQSLSEQAALQAQAISAAGGVMTSQWVDISAAAVKLSPEALSKLEKNPLVEYVEPDLERRALGFRSGGTTGNQTSQGLGAQAVTGQALTTPPYTASGEYTWGDNALKVEQLRASNYTGAGVAVCIGDTGIDGNHPEFQKKIKAFKNFTGEAGRDNPYALNDLSHHGTHVAGTVFAQYGAGTGAPLRQDEMTDPNGVGGVATGVNLYIARVLGDTGRGSSSSIINGVNWCASQLKSQGGTENKVVISLSLGGGRASQTEQRAYTSVWKKGAFTVIATGNESTAVSYPAAYTDTVAVGAIDNTEAKADFSNFGPQVDLVGPGVDVFSSVPLKQGTRSYAGVGGVRFANKVLSADTSSKGDVTGTVVKAGDGTGTAGANQFCGTGTRNPALSGNIALISRGTCTFEEKVANAVASGAKAVMIYNNTAGEMGLSLTNPYSIPVVGIWQSDGEATLAKLPATGRVEVLDADYESYNGTSMATPHVSAAAAVVWAAKPTLTNTQLLSLLTSTAKDLGPAGKDDNFGYGLVQPLKAITGQ
ncbi:MAG: S8 family serine peptidase [Deinococcus sp.]|uniref:S8 family serine peptidase n=1 Tax=Deinococcus sp. TaxID=47478 RepID=UPI0026DB225A|nr:S8 family serine peptidase [Deinococcus sp.]MDO4246914.1 S8 family serine peptidase [Deinococcus sp.]